MSKLNLTSIVERIVFLLYLFSLCVPNLVFSGWKFADTLFIMKWVAVLVPFFVIMLIIGFVFIFDRVKTQKFNLDVFAISLGILVFFCAAQYFFVKISSEEGFLKELLCFASIWLFYVLASNFFQKVNFSINPILWASEINAALNVAIAELQIRGLYSLEFLKNTAFEFLMPLRAFIRGSTFGSDMNYVGNTGMHNMFGVWIAVCMVSAAYLFLINIKRKKFFSAFMALLFMSINALGLLSSNSRSGLLSACVGLFVMGIIFAFRLGRGYRKYLAVIAAIFLLVSAGLILTHAEGINRMLGKLLNPAQYKTIAGRTGIWMISLEILKLHPMGVGIGQYKWHWFEGQIGRLNADPSMNFGWTLWAHNEFLQWFCESGIIGGLMLMGLLAFWFYKFISLFSERKEFSETTAWGCGVVFVFMCSALWSRPFHRIEDLVWLAFGFAICNREILENYNFNLSKKALKPFGLALVFSALFGAAYLHAGVQGNLILRKAWNAWDTTNDKSMLVAINLCKEASKYPIVTERARHDFAAYSLEYSEKKEDMDACEKYLQLLWESFQREPNPNDFNPFVIWGERLQREDILREFVRYQKPGAFVIETKEAKDEDGDVIEIVTIRSNMIVR